MGYAIMWIMAMVLSLELAASSGAKLLVAPLSEGVWTLLGSCFFPRRVRGKCLCFSFSLPSPRGGTTPNFMGL